MKKTEHDSFPTEIPTERSVLNSGEEEVFNLI